MCWPELRELAPADAELCLAAGAIYDERNRVIYVPPRVNLSPFARWLPFDLAAIRADKKTGIVADSPAIPHGSGPIKSDGSPNMSFNSNKRVREMLEGAACLDFSSPKSPLSPPWGPKPPPKVEAMPEPIM